VFRYSGGDVYVFGRECLGSLGGVARSKVKSYCVCLIVHVAAASASQPASQPVSQYDKSVVGKKKRKEKHESDTN
jgi:hypothetical protein